MQAVPLIGQSTKSTPLLGSTIASGNPELTTGERAEVGALIGGSKGTGNPPPLAWLFEEQAVWLRLPLLVLWLRLPWLRLRFETPLAQAVVETPTYLVHQRL